MFLCFPSGFHPDTSFAFFKRNAFLLPVLFLTLLYFHSSGAEAAPASSVTVSSFAALRVYGKVKATLGPNRVLFQCEDARHADILMGKLLADLFWDAGAGVQKAEIHINNQTLAVREWKPFGAILVARVGNDVLALGGANEKDVANAAMREVLMRSGKIFTSPQSPYPQTLDFYDLKAIKFYTDTMNSMRGFGLDSHWPFVRKFGLGGLAFQSLALNMSSPAPGVVMWAPSDYEVREAAMQHGLIVPSVEVAGGMPFWMRNEFPDAMAQPDPTALMIGWGGMASLSNTYCESWGAPLDLQKKYCLSFLKQVVKRYGGSPAVGGWQFYAGEPGAELGFHDRTTENLDYSPLGQDSFRNYLKLVKGYSLAGLGKRWYNDPAHFTSWNQVAIPDVHGFYGDLNSDSYRINTNWRWLPKDKSKAADGSIPTADADWLPVDMPPSEQQVTLPWPLAYYKVIFDAGKWIDAHTGRKIWLVCDAGIRSADGVHAWLNGNDLGAYKTPSDAGYGPFSIEVTSPLHNGSNDLTLLVPGEGKIIGPVFLTTAKPAFYPYLGAQRNAQYVDVKEWQPYSLYSLNDTVFREARQLDPDRAMGLASDEIETMGDKIADLAHDYNLSVQNTGREAWYFPWWPGLGLVDDFYATSESSATPSAPDLTRMFSWILFDGDSSTILFWNMEDFMKIEKDTGWFTQHKNDLRLEGKSLRIQPKIAIFRPVITQTLGDNSPWYWDIGRGELESAHFDNVYITERELLNGKASAYPVIFDCGSVYTDPKIISGIKRYVEAGGTFVAQQITGQSTTTVPDSYPIAQLTGFHVLKTTKNDRLRFERNLPVFHDWEGKTFEGDGLSLEPTAPGVIPLSKWRDGSTAIGYRKLGKGRVIMLGSNFWRNGEDISGIWLTQSDLERGFIDSLFTDLGVKRTADSSSPDVWDRKFITKNGLQDWLIAINSSSGPVTASVSMQADHRPDNVWDEITGSPVQFTYSNGWVTIPNVTIEERENRVFGMKRADLSAGMTTWWNEKLRFWKNIPKTGGVISIASGKSIKPAYPVGLDSISVNQWKYKTASGSALSDTQWRMPGFSDRGWSSIMNGPWNFQSNRMKSYKGTALYRCSFFAPASWAGHKVELGLYGLHTPIVYGLVMFALNGHPVATYDGKGYGGHDGETYNYDVTAYLKPGENVLSLKISSDEQFGGVGGVGGAVWLTAEPNLEQSQNIIDGWKVAAADYKTTTSALLPGNAHGRFLTRVITPPVSYKGKNVFLHLEMPNQWLGLVMVNGHPLYNTCYGQNFGTLVDINLAPFCRIGEPNKIELWSMVTEPRMQGQSQAPEADMSISAARIGYDGDTRR